MSVLIKSAVSSPSPPRDDWKATGVVPIPFSMKHCSSSRWYCSRVCSLARPLTNLPSGVRKRIREAQRCKRLGSLACLAVENHVRAAHKYLGSSARQAWRVHRELNNGTSEFASHSPDLSATSKVSLLVLPARGPSTCAISRADDGTTVRASLPGRSDANALVGCGRDHNLEAVTDLKITAGTARIEQTY